MVLRAAACVVAVAVAFLPAPAGAHDERALHALTVLDVVEPGVPGVEVRVVHLGGPALVARNESRRTLSVLDASGRPFLRVAASGVWINAESAFAYRSITPESDVVPPSVGSISDARWVRVSKESSWTWFDPRLAFERTDPEWIVPMRLGSEDLIARGGFESLHGHGHFRTALDPPEIEGLDVQLAEGPVPALVVSNETARVLLVEGRAGEPMLRIGPHGVEANLRSPSYYTSAAQTIARVPPSADTAARPRWKKVSEEPVWAWLEYRAEIDVEMQQRDLLGGGRRTVLTWDSRMVLDGRPVDVGGSVEWLPPVTPASTRRTPTDLLPWWIATVLLVGCGVVFSSIRRKAAVA